ncbi:NAD(P)-dependent oxidoreductase [Paraburkholderia dipogonis]|uniref:NAD(P)-dependent oxidoreductase n=1 Tax=Paraburkholderia dipogonis TaxID=1211383 RepID=A0A4Y8MHC1_9BURK|nr:NAD(P)-dependent oxidoreductase [Paraburkholderia dipogonis]TFE36815.1 NAD(P)-dependent oxidoreductase [Paraburkholderia dipogonis]
MSIVAFVGLGSMGRPMAENLLKDGYKVRGFDARAEAARFLDEQGGVACDSVEEAFRGADVALLMVVNGAQARSILESKQALQQLNDRAAVILMSTCAPQEVCEIAELVQAAGKNFVDAPVSGGVAGAQAGTLTIMAATDAVTMEAVRPVLNTVGEKVFHVGEKAGQGSTAKVVNQLLCGVHLAAAAEAFALAAKVGLDLGVVYEIVSGSAASSWMLKDRGGRMLQQEPNVTSTVDIFVKDLGLVLQAGRENHVALPLAAQSFQVFNAASGRGDGYADDSQVIRSYYALNGTTRS